MLHFNPYNLLAGFIFGMIGLGAWRYGKALDRTHPRLIGVALMAYPYLISHDILVWVVGIALLVLLWFFHHE